MNSLSEGKELVKRVRLNSIFPSKIVSFLQKRGKEEKLFVTDETGNDGVELVLNSRGQLCFLEGKSKKLIEGSGKDFYIDNGTLARVEEAYEVDNAARFGDEKPAVVSSEINVDLVNALRAIIGRGPKVRSVTKVVAPSKVKQLAVPEILRKTPSNRLKDVLDLIVKANGKYTISVDYQGRGKKITSSDCGNSAAIMGVLRALCREVELVNGELSVYLDFSDEEESFARKAGYKMTIIY